MDLYIGENIRRLRREKGITQEKLAEHLSISTQAVSKWERGETLPDITLVIPLASYFGVSTDDILGMDEARDKAKAEEMIDSYFRLNRECRWAEADTLLREAYRAYPNNWTVVYRYMWHLAGGNADNDPSHLIAHADELNAISDRLLDECTIDRYRLSTRNLKAKLAWAAGDTEEALELLSDLPSFYEARPQVTEQLFPKHSPEFRRQLHLNIFELADFTIDKIEKAIWFSDASMEEKIARTLRLAEWLEEIITETGYTLGYKMLGSVYSCLSKFCAFENRCDDTMRYLPLMAKHYQRYDTCIAGKEEIPGVPEDVAEHTRDGWLLYDKTFAELSLEWYRDNPRFAELQERGDFRALCEKYLR